MKIELEKQEHNVVKMNIEFPAKDAVEAYNRASQRISQHVNIPGFRRGKAPRNVVDLCLRFLIVLMELNMKL